MMPGEVLFFDAGVRCGFAHGAPRTPPASGVVILKRPSEPAAVAFSNLIAFLVVRFDAGKPLLVAKEAPFNFAAFAARTTSPEAVRITYGLHAIIEGICGRYAIPCHDIADSTVRLHFTGRGRAGDRNATKAMVVRRCHQLGYMDRGNADNDQADALAGWDYSVAHLARKAPRELVLFPPAARARPKRRRA